jgi:pimeloyl-ACP methyl ester carboxylesterase
LRQILPDGMGTPTIGAECRRSLYYLDGERMKMSGRFVKGPWRYEQIEGASHWIPLDASERLNQLLIDWLG